MKRPKMGDAEYRTAYVCNNLHDRLINLDVRINKIEDASKQAEKGSADKTEWLLLVGERYGIEAAFGDMLGNDDSCLLACLDPKRPRLRAKREEKEERDGSEI